MMECAQATRTATREQPRHAALLIHGLAGSPVEMKVVKSALEKAGYAVDMPLLPGHGTHFSDLKGLPWTVYTRFVEERFEALRRQYDSVSVSGLCLGAVLALHLGIRYGRQVNAIAPVSTTLFFDGWGLPKIGKLLKFWRFTPAYYLYNLAESHPFGIKDDRLRARLVSHMSAESTTHYSKIPFRAFWQMNLLNARVRDGLHRIQAPVHALHPIEDDVASTRSVDFMRAEIDPALFSFRLLEDCYHLATIDRQRHLVSASILRFFDDRVAALGGRPCGAAEDAPALRSLRAGVDPAVVQPAGAVGAVACPGLSVQ